MKSIESLLHRYQPPPGSSDYLNRGLEIIDDHPAGLPRTGWRWGVAGLAALLVVSLGLNIVLLLRTGQPAPIPDTRPARYIVSDVVRPEGAHLIREVRYGHESDHE